MEEVGGVGGLRKLVVGAAAGGCWWREVVTSEGVRMRLSVLGWVWTDCVLGLVGVY